MSEIVYYSTNLKAPKVSFGEALLKGLAPDGGLYMPEQIPQFSKAEIEEFSEMPYHEIAFSVLKKFLGEAIPAHKLAKMTLEAYNFNVPLEKVYDNKYIMRLDQGPTASFKDFAARMMGQLMQYFLEKENKKLLILTATSGDTGSAMANAFYNLHNINFCVLFPETEVTERQRKQMTTLHNNIQVVALDGKFDDCQALVKEAFNDNELNYLNLSSANSINIGRLIPQAVYYFYAYSRLCDIANNDEIVFSVPSGNFGDLMGGLLAMNMGLPVKKFVVATNENDEVPVYFASGNYKTIVPSKACISSAMNVGHPSNMARIVALYGGVMNPKGEILEKPDLEKMKNDMFSVSIADEITRETIKSVYERHKVILEPHGAVGWEGLRNYMNYETSVSSSEQVCVSLETAHPAKFPEEIKRAINIEPELPASLSKLDKKEEQFDKLNPVYSEFKAYLKKNY
jgi:threonine synthase